MSIDNTRLRHDNQVFLSAGPRTAPISEPETRDKPEIRDNVEGLSVLVLDLDQLGLEKCLDILAAATEDSRLVLWFPWRYTPAQVVTMSQQLVDIGATPFERSEPNQTLLTCWDAAKAELLARITERRKPKPGAN
jgi:hypothetical protein